MADVARLREADRGQLFLVGALALAVIFVTLAVLLNTAIYTGNIATRDPGPGTGEVVEYEGAAAAMADRSVRTANVYNNSSYADLEATFEGTVSVWSSRTNVHTSTALADAHVRTMSILHGTKIGQNGTRNFTGADGDVNWTVANDSRARSFALTVEQDSLTDDDLFQNESEFAVEFSEGDDTLTLYIYNNSTATDNVTVGLYDGNSTSDKIDSCSGDAGTDDRATVDISGEQLAGDHCEALGALNDRLPNRYNITFQNSDQAEGNYSLVVDRSLGEFQTGANVSGTPYAAPALYSAELQVTYRSSVTYYRSEIRVAPEEPDE